MERPYPSSYHAAVNRLIRYGAWYYPRTTRTMIARALRDLRQTHGNAFARRERHHMAFICGCFPPKVK